ncbi:rhodanese-like domain-containing protein [Christiangramia portivictoriae]|uniref:rhodanese-like domain-containing protein n=1 Tax=Christiangramia portivictoriae TaxID=326069 RepID=UPI0003FBF785|nr:rhodanese-like domain-containing protein [Christiangramia portivictoriae]
MKVQGFVFSFIMVLATSVYSQSSLDELLKKYNSGDVSYTSVEQLRMDQLNDEVIILDAREREEYRTSHLRNSRFIGYDHVNLSLLDTVSRDKKIVVYCSIGIRSEKIAHKIQALGFKEVRNLYGGIFEWKNAGFPVFDQEEMETEKIHTFSKHWSKYLKNGEKIY